MLKRIKKLKSIGRFQHASGIERNAFQQYTLIYGPNGSGKSTLADLLKSAANGSTHRLEERRTINSDESPTADLQFSDGRQAKYQDGQWHPHSPADIHVFDADFIDENVHTGHTITPTHRRNLLDFALGSAAVDAQKREREATDAYTTASREARNLEAQVNRSVPEGMTLHEFIKLEAPEDFNTEIEHLHSRRESARREAHISQLPQPATICYPEVNFEELQSLLSTTLKDFHNTASESIRNHLEELPGSNPLKWIKEGQQFDDRQTCPYCNQSTMHNQLIEAYATHFNEEFEKFTARLEAAREAFFAALPENLGDQLHEQSREANSRTQVWNEHISDSLDQLQLDSTFDESIKCIRDQVATLLDAKLATPSEPIAIDALLTAQHDLQRLLRPIQTTNASVARVQDLCNTFIKTLSASPVNEIERQIAALQAHQGRNTEPTSSLIDEYQNAQKEVSRADTAKHAARHDLNQLMDSTLRLYHEAINSTLRNLGAKFSIEEINRSYVGGSPRAEYKLSLRNQQIDINRFATALSEGDKRTLAFAFFVASTLSDPNLEEKIVVIDDPMSSFDRSRKYSTIEVISNLAKQAAQIIVLAHDENFLRDLTASWAKDKEIAHDQLSTLQVEISGTSSTLVDADLDELCATAYITNYRVVQGFLDGHHADAKKAADALRPLLEGYLHRKYPTHIRSSSMLGDAINQIEYASSESPLYGAHNSVQELRYISSYASRFHHDNQPDHKPHSELDPYELQDFCQRVLNIIHRLPSSMLQRARSSTT